MGGRKKIKPFIDKKNSVTFKLVGRSQNDPLFLDENAPQYVLVEKKTREQVELDREQVKKSGGVKKPLTKEERKAEQAKFGIYYDDDYDYLQHLVDVEEIPSVSLVLKDKMVSKDEMGESSGTNKPKIMLPSSVFDTGFQEKDDLIKKAALPVGPQLHWDPDIVEAMDDDFDLEDPQNVIDDDFIMQAMEPPEEGDISSVAGPYKVRFSVY